MNRNILLIVVISLGVSIIQIKNLDFFVNTVQRDRMTYLEGEDRIGSIYTWVSANSIGITFPILISILLNFYTTRNFSFYLVVLSGIVVSFLSKGRYVMISAIIVFSQLIFSKLNSLANLISIIAVFAGSFFLIIYGAKQIGYNIDEVINNRILEKDSEMASAKARVLSYEVFLKKFPEHPILGVGPATRNDVLILLQGEAPLIHVGFLCYLYYYGLVGCFFIFAAIFFLFKDAWYAGKMNNFWGTFYGLISLCLANLTFVYFEFSEMGMVLGVIYLRYYSLKPTLTSVADNQQ